MSETVTLRTAGPHSPDYTRQVAWALAECVRVLNYATAPWTSWPGLEFPGDVYDALGAVKTGAYGLQQAFGQMSGFLQEQLAAGRVRLDSGGDPAAAVRAARAELSRARGLAAQLHDCLEHAQRHLGHVAAVHGRED